jgi:uncharacterized protein (TIGR03086 family)
MAVPSALDDPIRRHAQAVAAFTRRVSAIGPGLEEAPTPCSDWDVRALVGHLVDEHRWLVPLLSGRTIAEAEQELAPAVDGSLEQVWEAARAAAEPVVAEADLGSTVSLSYGDAPAAHYLSELTTDVVVHDWDLATAIGVEPDLDPDLVAAVLAWVEPRAPGLADTGLFAPPHPVADDADALSRLVALTGRRPVPPRA